MVKDQQKPSNSSAGFIAVVFFLTAAIFYFYSQRNDTVEIPRDPATTHRTTAEAEVLVNKYLKETNTKIESQKRLSEVENNFIVPRIGELVPIAPDTKKTFNVDGPEDINQKKLRETFAPDVSREDSSPRGVIESQLADKQRIAEYDREYRHQYTKAFIENARINGWIIKVDKNGVVIQATPISGFEENQ